MLSTEAFCDCVAFLRLFDLSALAVTNALCSSVALKASAAIRCEEFPGLRFYVVDCNIYILESTPRKDEDGRAAFFLVKSMGFSSENDLAEFVTEAFPNCIIDNLDVLPDPAAPVLDAIFRVADSVVGKTLRLPGNMATSDSLQLIRKMRKVQVGFLF